jgi:FdhE protein
MDSDRGGTADTSVRPTPAELRDYNRRVSTRPDRAPTRQGSREIAELRQLKASQPDLAAAAELQIELLTAQRRVQSRIPVPNIVFDKEKLYGQRQKPLLQFKDIPLDWGDFRLMVRQTADILRRFDTLDSQEHARIQALAREGQIEQIVAAWYSAPHAESGSPAGQGRQEEKGMLDQVLLLAMRPFLARCAEAILPRMELSGWRQPRCPMCGGEPEFGFINPAAERLLICGRCTGQWRYDPLTCPFCENGDRSRITSFTSRDGKYRLYACDVCRRYLKAFDGRDGSRPVLLAVDSVATLPLDAAAMQRGYQS